MLFAISESTLVHLSLFLSLSLQNNNTVVPNFRRPMPSFSRGNSCNVDVQIIKTYFISFVISYFLIQFFKDLLGSSTFLIAFFAPSFVDSSPNQVKSNFTHQFFKHSPGCILNCKKNPGLCLFIFFCFLHYRSPYSLSSTFL